MTACELYRADVRTPQGLRSANRATLVRGLGRSGYRRYDERTAARLRQLPERVLDRYRGELAAEAGGSVDRAGRLLQEFPGIGPTGASVFLREVQAVWPWVRPYLDHRARAGTRWVGLPDDDEVSADLVPVDDLARFTAALVRVSLLPRRSDPLGR